MNKKTHVFECYLSTCRYLLTLTYRVAGGLAPACGPHQHDPVADLHRLVELDDLLDLRLDDLEFLGLHHVLDFLLQTAVVVLRNLHSREQVLKDGLQRNIFLLQHQQCRNSTKY